MRGLGCSARFFLTAGREGDALPVATLVDSFLVDVAIANAAYDSDAFRNVIAAKGTQAFPELSGVLCGAIVEPQDAGYGYQERHAGPITVGMRSEEVFLPTAYSTS